MYLPIKFRRFIVSITLLVNCALFASCSNQDFDALSTISRREVPVVQADVQVDGYYNGDISVEPVLPSESVNAEDTGNDALYFQRFELLKANFNNSARQACNWTAEQTVIAQRISYEEQGGYQIVQIEELEVVNDFRKTFPIPGKDEKVVVLQCNSLSRFDIGGDIYEGRMMIFLLVDDLGQNRARWEPDLATVKKVG